MLHSICLGARAGRILSFCALVTAASGLTPAATLAQHDDHEAELDHGHEYLHFSHPLITESPSPDTKFRFDAAFSNGDEPPGARATELRGEFEYGLTRDFSLAVVAPFIRVTSPSDARASALGSVEVSAKAASLRFAHSGVLVGGGMSLGLPTGNDAKGIGSGHLYELAPFVDAAVRRGEVEMVGFVTYSTVVNRKAGEPSERSLTLNGSVLWRIVPEFELLGEIETSRAIGGAEGSYYETFLAPGIKWRPSAMPKLAAGISALRGVGNASGNNGVQISLFYHF